jgi:glycosyltransferase involved in cell wall biosynthesis
MKRISIVTPCYNAEKFIEETATSVLNQTAILNGRCELEYIICDGASNDDTISILEKLRSTIKQYNIKININSEKDTGMYDALSKGLQSVSGNICAYLNAGDYYSKYAFDVLLDLEELYKWRWITGLNVVYNRFSQIIEVKLPYRYRNKLLNCGIYGKKLPFIQQESTFWNADLNRHIDFDCLANFKLSGDYYLWSLFAKYEELKIVVSYLGGFRKIKGQLSENKNNYFAEFNKIIKNPSLYDYAWTLLDKVCWALPNKIKKRLNRNSLYRYNCNNDKWEL